MGRGMFIVTDPVIEFELAFILFNLGSSLYAYVGKDVVVAFRLAQIPSRRNKI